MSKLANRSNYMTEPTFTDIDGMVSAFGREYVMNYCVCSAFKYIWRCEYHGSRASDIQKAINYLTQWMKLAEEEAEDDDSEI